MSVGLEGGRFTPALRLQCVTLPSASRSPDTTHPGVVGHPSDSAYRTETSRESGNDALLSTAGGTRSSSWSARDDETLIQARAQGLNWNQIGPKHFPLKTPNACRKRHERLIERQNAEQWDGVKLDVLAQAYIEIRRDMWSMLAARVGEKWQLVETKCMEKGLKNLTQAFRSAQKKLENGTYHDHEDSGIGISDLDMEEETQEDNDGLRLTQSYSAYSAYSAYPSYPHPQQRVPSIQSMLQPMQHPQQRVPSIQSMLQPMQHPQQRVPSIQPMLQPMQDSQQQATQKSAQQPTLYTVDNLSEQPHSDVAMSGDASLDSTTRAFKESNQSEPVEEATVEHARTKHTRDVVPDEHAAQLLNQCSLTRTRYSASSNARSASATDQLGFRNHQSDAHANIQPSSNFIAAVNPSSASTADASTQTRTEHANESRRFKSEADLSNCVNTGGLHPTIAVGNDQVGAVRSPLQYENIHVYQRGGWFRDSTPLEHAQDTRNTEAVDPVRAPEPKGYTISPTSCSLMRNERPSSEQTSHLSKEQAFGQLVAHSHNVPTTRDSTLHTECANPETTDPPKDSAPASQRHLGSSAKKRTHENIGKDGEGDPNNDEDDDDDGSRKRRRKNDRSMELNLASPKRFACPYFKHDPFKDRSSRACSGPGFLTIAKLKDHLYRVHALPPHCKRCYTTFVDDTALTAHSRSANGCAVTDAKLVEGFDNEQLLKLKNKQSMHQAGNEENQWKFVYCVLFPDTRPFEVPFPYYGHDAEVTAPSSKRQFLKPSDLTQFYALLCRELPRKVRKACWAIMERKVTLMGEILKNEVEDIVKGCLQDLSSAYLDSVRTQATRTREMSIPEQAVPTSTLNGQAQNQCHPQSYVMPSYWHNNTEVSNSPTLLGCDDLANWTNNSQAEHLHSSCFDSAWFDPAPTEDMPGNIQAFEFTEPAQAHHDMSEYTKEDFERGVAAD